MKLIKPSENNLLKYVKALKEGNIVICPTDTIYGFLADAANKKAVERIYKIKKRPKSKPLSVFVKDFKMASDIALIDTRQAKILRKFWPGKYTFILNRKTTGLTNSTAVGFVRPRMAKRIYGIDKKTIAIRIPKYKFLNELLKKINRPLAQTSVNISAEVPLESIDEIAGKFGKHKDILIINGGNFKKSKPSKIIDLTEDKTNILRR